MKLSRKRSNFEKTKPAWTCRDSNTIFTPAILKSLHCTNVLNDVTVAPFSVFFLLLAAEKKTAEMVQLWHHWGRLYLVMTLVNLPERNWQNAPLSTVELYYKDFECASTVWLSWNKAVFAQGFVENSRKCRSKQVESAKCKIKSKNGRLATNTH